MEQEGARREGVRPPVGAAARRPRHHSRARGRRPASLDEPPVQLFLPGHDGQGPWLDAHEWPLPHTTWHSFYLHRDGLLSEHEHWPFEGASGYEDNTYNDRGAVTFTTPALVERT